jgi:hypothetical protein
VENVRGSTLPRVRVQCTKAMKSLATRRLAMRARFLAGIHQNAELACITERQLLLYFNFFRVFWITVR